MKKIKKIIFLLVFALIFGSFAGVTNAKSLKGRILLQVEQNGEAWYVASDSEERTYMGRPKDAFSLMREIGVGISNIDIEKIQVGDKNLSTGVDSDGDGLSDRLEDALGTDKDDTDTDGDGNSDKTEILAGYDPTSTDTGIMIDSTFASKQAGKILIQVEQNGEAWYVYPEDNKRYFLGLPSDAFNLMRQLGLGISDNDLGNIQVKGEGNQVQNETQNKNGENYNNIMTESCVDLSEGDTCEITGPDGEIVSGTCEVGRDDELMCRGEMAGGKNNDEEKGNMPEGNQPNNTEMIEICVDLSEGDTCEFSGMNGETMSGTCEMGREDELMCRGEMGGEQPGGGRGEIQGGNQPDFTEMIESCAGLSEGDTCESTGMNGETMTGTCETGQNGDELMCHPSM